MHKFLIILACALLGACTSYPGPKQGAGTLLGAAGGGLAGAQIGSGAGGLAATAGGALLGALLGSEIGSSLDRADQVYFERQAVAAAAARRQVPPAIYDYGVPSYGPRRQYSAPVARPVAPAQSSSCRRADEGFNPVFICHDGFGRWFVTQ